MNDDAILNVIFGAFDMVADILNTTFIVLLGAAFRDSISNNPSPQFCLNC